MNVFRGGAEDGCSGRWGRVLSETRRSSSGGSSEDRGGWGRMDTGDGRGDDCLFSWCADLQNVFSQDITNLSFLQKNGDVIYSKVLTGNRKVFRLEAELNASPEELQDILFFRVEEMHDWNPSISRIKVKHTYLLLLCIIFYILSIENALNWSEVTFIMLQNILISNKCCYFELSIHLWIHKILIYYGFH